MKKIEWIIRGDDNPTITEYSQKLNRSPLIAKLLWNRGIRNISDAKLFFNADITYIFNSDERSIYNPFNMKGVKEASERIYKAICNKDKIGIHGDYDVDGITGTSLLYNFLKQSGIECEKYIPRRIEEGYDISEKSIDFFCERGVKLIITNDCGISAVNQIDYAKSQNIDVIITDHHEPPAILPRANIIINPKQKDCMYPFSDLAGVGVVFCLVIALRSYLRDKGWYKKEEVPNLREYLDLVAIGTIADIVPLIGINRIFVKYGLFEIQKSRRTGITALREICGWKDNRMINCGMVGYNMAPRLNAAGRVGDANRGVELLTAQDMSTAQKLADELDRNNKERQDIEAQILKDALDKIEKDAEFDKKKSIVLYSDKWHPGVIGIVASKLVERFYKPTILISTMIDPEGDETTINEGKGSARSIKHFNIYNAISSCKDLLLAFGGHELAAGLSITISDEALNKFQDKFEKVVSETIKPENLVPKLEVDAEILPKETNLYLVEDIKSLEPFGHSNVEPIFVLRGMNVDRSEIVGKGHLKLRLSRDGEIFDAIGFNMKDYYPLNKNIDIAFVPQLNEFYNPPRIQLKIKDIKNRD